MIRMTGLIGGAKSLMIHITVSIVPENDSQLTEFSVNIARQYALLTRGKKQQHWLQTTAAILVNNSPAMGLDSLQQKRKFNAKPLKASFGELTHEE